LRSYSSRSFAKSLDHLLGEGLSAGLTPQVGGGVDREGCGYRVLHLLGHIGTAQGMGQQQGRRKYGGGGIGDALAGNIGG